MNNLVILPFTGTAEETKQIKNLIKKCQYIIIYHSSLNFHCLHFIYLIFTAYTTCTFFFRFLNIYPKKSQETFQLLLWVMVTRICKDYLKLRISYTLLYSSLVIEIMKSLQSTLFPWSHKYITKLTEKVEYIFFNCLRFTRERDLYSPRVHVPSCYS